MHITLEPFSEANGLLTPTSKMKRNDAKKHFAEQIEKLYSMPRLLAPKRK